MSQNKERSGGNHKHGHGRKRQHHQKNNRQRQPRPAPHLNYESLLHRFMACVDCGYFFTAYRAHHGQEVVRHALTASNQNRDGWIDLPWDMRTGELLHRFYEVRSDTHIDHLEFMCDSCQRKFVCAEVEEQAPAVDTHSEQKDESEIVESDPDEDVSEAVESTAVDESHQDENVEPEPETVVNVSRTLRVELKIR